MKKYKNRTEAGKVLAKSLQSYANDPSVVILALPRGGIPVAYEIAKSLSAFLEIFSVRKLGVPGYEELAFGAIVMGGITIFNNDVIKTFGISQQEMDHITALEQQELKRREKIYRTHQPLPDLRNKKIIIIDDGMATGTTIRVVINALRKLSASYIVIAVPVAAKATCNAISMIVDDIICPLQPAIFSAVNEYYMDFTQTTDTEIYQLLGLK